MKSPHHHIRSHSSFWAGNFGHFALIGSSDNDFGESAAQVITFIQHVC
jgi:hypothetical protein